MKLKDITNANIKSYIEGNLRYFLNNRKLMPDFIMEQVYYRLQVCKNDCVVTGRCKVCNCPTKKKAFATRSCNNGELFPDLFLDEGDWEEYKLLNNIKIDDERTQL